MDIKESKYFTETDLKVLRALGFRKPEVEEGADYGEEIYLGHDTYLYGQPKDIAYANTGYYDYFVYDRDSEESYRHTDHALMAIAEFMAGHLACDFYDDIPDFFWPNELHTITTRLNLVHKVVTVKRCQTCRSELGYAFVINGDGSQIKIAKNKFTNEDNYGHYVPLPDELPAFDEWEAIVGKDGKPLVADCSHVFKTSSYREQCCLLNRVTKELYDRMD